jgi:hypothetical protein
VTGTLPLDVRELCHWRRGLATEQTHTAYHYGSCCPYDVVAAILAGAPDPRDNIAEWRIDISDALTPKGTVPLSLNDRGMHWAAHAKAVARVKAAVRNAVMAADIPHLDYVHVEMHYRPKTNRFRDVDNTVATLKVAIDALHHRDTSENAPVPYEPIIDGDDPRFLSWTPTILHPAAKGRDPGLWLVLRSTAISGAKPEPVEQLELG